MAQVLLVTRHSSTGVSSATASDTASATYCTACRCPPAKGSQYMDNMPQRSGAAGTDQESQLSAMLSSPSAGGMRLAGNYAHRGSPGEFLFRNRPYSEPTRIVQVVEHKRTSTGFIFDLSRTWRSMPNGTYASSKP